MKRGPPRNTGCFNQRPPKERKKKTKESERNKKGKEKRRKETENSYIPWRTAQCRTLYGRAPTRRWSSRHGLCSRCSRRRILRRSAVTQPPKRRWPRAPGQWWRATRSLRGAKRGRRGGSGRAPFCRCFADRVCSAAVGPWMSRDRPWSVMRVGHLKTHSTTWQLHIRLLYYYHYCYYFILWTKLFVLSFQINK